LAGTSEITPKAGDDWVEQLRILRVARRSAIQARTQTINQMYAVVVGAPADLRDELHRLSRHQLIAQAARFRVGQVDDVRSVVRWTLRLLAQRHQALSAEIVAIDSVVAPLIRAHAGALHRHLRRGGMPGPLVHDRRADGTSSRSAAARVGVIVWRKRSRSSRRNW
jgi:transposase